MRALVILVLAGALLWLALQGFRSVRAEEETPPAPPRAGFILPPREPEPVAPTHPARPAPSEAGTKEAMVPAGISPAPALPSPLVREAVSPEPPSVAKSASARDVSEGAPSSDEQGLAGLILQRPRDVPEFLEGPGRSLPKGRRQLALALHHLVLGSAAEVRRIAEDLDSGDAVRVEEVEFLRGALGSPPSPIDAAGTGSSPMILAASLSRLARDAAAHLAAGRSREASLAYSELLLGVLDAPWRTDREFLQAWSEGLMRAQAGYRWNPRADWPSIAVKVESGDSLIQVRKRAIEAHPDLLVCTGEIARANGLRGETIHPGEVLKIPTAHANVLVDLDSHWLLFRMDSEVVAAWEVGIGKAGSETPPGEYRTGEKSKEPMWFRPGQPPVPFGDPENPLGTRWIAWQFLDGRNSSLGFHGTSDPASIGDDRSLGCIRMRKEAIEEMYEILPRGAVIRVRS